MLKNVFIGIIGKQIVESMFSRCVRRFTLTELMKCSNETKDTLIAFLREPNIYDDII